MDPSLPLSSDTPASNAEQFCQPGRLESSQPIKICRVCGARAQGFNWGVVCCESCKAFFRRSMFPVLKRFICANTGQCPINEQTRRFCCACRFRKCLQVGMKASKMLPKPAAAAAAAAAATTSNAGTRPKSVNTAAGERYRPLSAYERQCLRHLEEAGRQLADERVASLDGIFENLNQAFDCTEIYVRNLINFAKTFISFGHLSTSEQLVVIKKVYLSQLIVRTSFIYNGKLEGFPLFKSQDNKSCLFLPLSKFEVIMDKDKVERCKELSNYIHNVFQGDRLMMLIYSAVLLFGCTPPQENAISCGEGLYYYTHFYQHLLRRYLIDKYRDVQTSMQKYNLLMGPMHTTLQSFVELVNKELLVRVNKSQLDHVAVEIYNLV